MFCQNRSIKHLQNRAVVKFIYSEKATKLCEIFPLLLTVCTVVKSKGKSKILWPSQNMWTLIADLGFRTYGYGYGGRSLSPFLQPNVFIGSFARFFQNVGWNVFSNCQILVQSRKKFMLMKKAQNSWKYYVKPFEWGMLLKEV